jgi:predicted nucleic acid-binding protein
VIVLSDASPLISLSRISQLDLLPKLYHQVTITPQVYAEVAVSGAGMAGSSEIAKATWIEVRPVNDPEELERAKIESGLGLGELSTILLAPDLNADLILIDELKARKEARKRRLVHVGCVGVLEDAFQTGLLKDLRAEYRQLIATRAFVSRQIVDASLERLRLPPLDPD